MNNLKTAITHDGQRYVDEPIHAMPKPVAPLTLAVRHAMASLRIVGHSIPKSVIEVPHPVTAAEVMPPDVPQPLLLGYERVRLRWMTSDGKGGLKERD